MDYLFLMSGFLLSLLLGMMIVPKILLISYKNVCLTCRIAEKYTKYLYPVWVASPFSGDIDSLVLHSRGTFLLRLSIENLPTNVFLFLRWAV